MATNTQRIDDLEKRVNGLNAEEKVTAIRIHGLEQADARSETATTAVREELDRIRQKQAEADQRNALLEATVKELKVGTDKWGQRLWQLAAGLAVAVLSWFAGRLTKP